MLEILIITIPIVLKIINAQLEQLDSIKGLGSRLTRNYKIDKNIDDKVNLIHFCVRISTITAISIIRHRFKSTPIHGPRFTEPGLPWWSHIQVLTDVDVH